MLAVGEGVDVKELAGRLEDRAGVLGGFLLCDELLLFDAEHPDRAEDADKEERQLIGDIRAVLVEHLEHKTVGKGAQRVEQTVDHGDREGDPAFGVVVIGCVLARPSQLLVLVGLDKAEGDHADAHERHRDERDGRQILADAGGDQRQHRDDRAGAVADRGGDRKLDIAQPEIADGHREDIEHRDRQIGQDDLATNLNAVEEDLIGSVQPHHKTHGHDHFQMTVFVLCVLAADLGEQVRAAPAEQCDDCESKPHNSCFLFFPLAKPRVAIPIDSTTAPHF